MFLSKEEEMMIFWDRFVYMGVVFIPALLYHFSLLFTESEERRGKLLSYGGYFLSLVFLLLSRTDYFVSGLFRYRWGVHTQAQFFHHLFLIYFAFYITLALLKIHHYSREVKNALRRNQARYVFFAFLIFIPLGSLAYLPAYGISVYPFPYLSGVFFVSALAYAIVRYRLMDIKLVITRSILFFILVSYVALTFTFLMFLAGQFLRERAITSYPFIIFLISLVIVFSLEPMKKIIAHLTETIFFKGRIDYQKALKEISKVIAEELELDRLLRALTETVIKELKVEKAFILIRKNGNFCGQDQEKEIKITLRNPLIKYLKTTQQVVITEELEREISDLTEGRKRAELEKIKEQLEKLGAALCLPVVTEGRLIAIFILGRKFSGDMFTSEEIRIFEVLATQLSAALEKSRLYEEVQSFSEKLKDEVERATQELKKANIQLQELDRLKTEFISMASHQLRTPLTGLKGYLSMLLEGDFGEFSPSQKRIFSDLLESTNRLIRLVNLMLNISRIEAGRLKIEKKSVQMEKLVEDILKIFRPLIEKKKLFLEFKKPLTPLPLIKVDADKIKDVISNLLDNALRYTLKGGIKIQLEKKNSEIVFSIEDTGIGLSQDELLELFKKFSRGKRVGQIYTGGTGLGLFICEKIIKAHGGKIWAESEGEGKGSKFSFSLPQGY
jgi:signal transduction histidine kinase